jgi:hypothetical protein
MTNRMYTHTTVNSILPTEIKKGHSGSPPKKVVLSSKARISVSVESLTFKRISLFQTEPDLLAQNHRRAIGLYQDLDFADSVGKLTAHFQILE